MNPRAFDYYVRTITAALLSLAITGVALYATLTMDAPNPFLIGSAGIVLGTYFGAHISQNGRATQPRADDDALTVITQHKPHGG